MCESGEAQPHINPTATQNTRAMTVSSPPLQSTAQKREWEEHVDTATGKVYFHNVVTNKTTWKKPSVLGRGHRESTHV